MVISEGVCGLSRWEALAAAAAERAYGAMG